MRLLTCSENDNLELPTVGLVRRVLLQRCRVVGNDLQRLVS